MMKPSNSRKTHAWLKKSSLSLIGGLAFVGSGLGELAALATTQSFVIDATPAVSSNEAPTPKVNPAPKAPVSKPISRKEPTKPIYKVSPKSSVSSQPQTKLAAPKIAVPQPKVQISRPEVTTPSPQVTIQGKNSYVDAKRYGVTQPVPPTSVVLTERSSGCQTVAHNGQLTQGNCGVALKKPVPLAQAKPEAPRRQTASKTVARSNSRRQSTQYQPVARRSQPQFAPRPISSQSVVSLQPIERRGLSLSLEPVAPYNRATRPYSQAIDNLAQQTTDLLYPLPIIGELTSAFGWRQHPIHQTRRFHHGTDIGAPQGTPVLASYQGTVESADWAGGYGLMVVLRHLDGTQESRYAHLSEIFVEPGQWVERGEVIGRVGSTGYSTGPHLHFEWRHNTDEGWVAVDAGFHLELALDNLIRSLEYAQQLEKPQS